MGAVLSLTSVNQNSAEAFHPWKKPGWILKQKTESANVGLRHYSEMKDLFENSGLVLK